MDLSNPSHPVLSGLLRKRQEIAAEIEEHQAKLHGLVLDIDAIDATIRLFSPALDVQTVRVRPTPRRHGVQPGDTSRLVLSLIRENGPLSHREMTLKVMEHRGLSAVDRVLYTVMRNRIGASIRGMAKRRSIVKAEGDGDRVRWGLAAD